MILSPNDLVDGALVAMDRLHHPLQDLTEELGSRLRGRGPPAIRRVARPPLGPESSSSRQASPPLTMAAAPCAPLDPRRGGREGAIGDTLDAVDTGMQKGQLSMSACRWLHYGFAGGTVRAKRADWGAELDTALPG
jgi:hypothetical protein